MKRFIIELQCSALWDTTFLNVLFCILDKCVGASKYSVQKRCKLCIVYLLYSADMVRIVKVYIRNIIK